MHSMIAQRRDDIAALCRRYGVQRMEVFGSAARAVDFNPTESDADFLVTFGQHRTLPALEQFFGLAAALEDLLGRPVDLIEDGAVSNPYVRASIDAARELVYAA